MRKIIASFLLILVPNFCLAFVDACTHPAEYSIDKRCYVTNDQKSQKPYNAVVGVLDDYGNNVCTGTIVKEDGILYLITAKHCVINNMNIPVDRLKIRLQNGATLDVSKDFVGSYYMDKKDADKGSTKEAYNLSGDWAVYRLSKDANNADFVNFANKMKWDRGTLADYYDARVIGYGSLKIMSDKEIKDFKQDYISYLLKAQNISSANLSKEEKKYGLENGGVFTENPYVKDFLSYVQYEKDDLYYIGLLQDNDNLKVSKCKYYSDGRRVGCQTWNGNSGGGFFDNNGDLMGIHTRGAGFIGGRNHADAEDLQMFPSGENDSIILLNY